MGYACGGTNPLQVNELHAKALALGGIDEGAPGLAFAWSEHVCNGT